MGRLSREQKEVMRKQEQKAEQNKRFSAKRYHASVNLPLEWKAVLENIAKEEGYVYNGSATVGGYIKDLIEADLRRRGIIQEED